MPHNDLPSFHWNSCLRLTCYNILSDLILKQMQQGVEQKRCFFDQNIFLRGLRERHSPQNRPRSPIEKIKYHTHTVKTYQHSLQHGHWKMIYAFFSGFGWLLVSVTTDYWFLLDMSEYKSNVDMRGNYVTVIRVIRCSMIFYQKWCKLRSPSVTGTLRISNVF